MRKPNNMRWSDVMNLLDQEIEWCIENPTCIVDKKYANGFIDGLKQAKYLITRAYKIEMIASEEGRMSNCTCGETSCICPF